MIRSAALLFRERGVEGTAIDDVLEHADAPRGSTYHHFPGGKQQLARETTEYAGDVISVWLEQALTAEDPIEGLRKFVDSWVEILRDGDYEVGCAIAAGALTGGRSPGARDAAGRAFTHWSELIADAFSRKGVDPSRAAQFATLVVAAVEGAVVLARAQRTTEPLERVAAELFSAASALVPQRARVTKRGTPQRSM